MASDKRPAEGALCDVAHLRQGARIAKKVITTAHENEPLGVAPDLGPNYFSPLLDEAADEIERLRRVVDVVRELEMFVWANPGYPDAGPPGSVYEERQHANAKKRQELAQKVNDAIQAWERGE